MKFNYLLLLILGINISAAYPQGSKLQRNDTTTVIELNKKAYENRLVDPQQTLDLANRALKMSQDLDYTRGIAESFRNKGIAKYYQNESDSAIENYLQSLTYFNEAKDLSGEAKVYNNIGNLYRDFDYDKAIDWFNKSLEIAKRLGIKDLIAGLNLNIGIIYQKQKKYNQALQSFEQSQKLFEEIKNPTGITTSYQNIGVTYFRLNQLQKAEENLIKAVTNAKQFDLNFIIASCNLTLSSIYIIKGEYIAAENSITEGKSFAQIIGDDKLQSDFLHVSYELEFKRKNFEKALSFLREVYEHDSVIYNNRISNQLALNEREYAQRVKQQEQEVRIQRQKTNNILFGASVIVSALCIFVIFLLVGNVRRKAKTNEQLHKLNEEVSVQKENVDRINQNLEEIILERTKDLEIKNRKLSEYSSHLSHQIRGPVATLKGLLILDNDKLIEDNDFKQEIKKCIDDIDNKIHPINETLNSPDMLNNM